MNRIYLSVLFICTLTIFAIGCGSNPAPQGVVGIGNGVIPSPGAYGYGSYGMTPGWGNYGYNGVYGGCPMGYVGGNTVTGCAIAGAGVSCGTVPGYAGTFAWNGGMCLGSGLSAAYPYPSSSWNYGYGAFAYGGNYYYPQCRFSGLGAGLGFLLGGLQGAALSGWYCY